MNGTFEYNEQVVRLCTRICNSIEHPHKTILLTGVSERDPVSAFAYEAARTLVLLGASPVLLVDANFQRTRGTSFVTKSTTGPGLLDVLRQDSPLSEALFADELPGLMYLDSGSTDCDYHALLHSEQCADLLKELRQDYAFVIIESGSLINHSECLRLAERVDGVAVVVQPGLHQNNQLSQLKQAVDGFNVPFLGVIFCSQPVKKLW